MLVYLRTATRFLPCAQHGAYDIDAYQMIPVSVRIQLGPRPVTRIPGRKNTISSPRPESTPEGLIRHLR